ncbi:NAD-dependent epimerase/dehydratase family protein [Pengzhenrongella sicca]|uniref:NAD-dependent epimerase/dehydratase family protein n=1 Tax=Pengzhenrongella sicca TaxID=2819238 RepID=A0A8A4ZI90_9MICO|nr:NAD-dependent epimerase/dehydratase family protein [Pengzhenrongella sicca]QTE30237.1 NAD-dependent epimerase/dehydratase family protein [Pengzhenrongella sicca]
MTPGPPIWVVGAGGLLGGAIVRLAGTHGRDVLVSSIPWHDAAAAATALAQDLDAVVVRAAGGPWDLLWCAGSGVTSTGERLLDAEVRTIRQFIDEAIERHGAGLGRGAVFMASTAGGIYAGSVDPPFDELSPPQPLSAYGEAKLAAEKEFARLAAEVGCRVLVGRMSNLYGPGQNLAKSQGLISQLCRSQLLGEPIGVYVSLDTVRDYLFVDDAAALILDGLAMLRDRASAGSTVVKILASQRSSSVAAVLGEFRRIFKRGQLLRLAASAQSGQQARDLRFRSVVWTDLDRRTMTPLPAGIAATAADIGRRIRAGELAAVART